MPEPITQKLEILRTNPYQLLSGGPNKGVILNNGAVLVIIGRPNVRKSSSLKRF